MFWRRRGGWNLKEGRSKTDTVTREWLTENAGEPLIGQMILLLLRRKLQVSVGAWMSGCSICREKHQSEQPLPFSGLCWIMLAWGDSAIAIKWVWIGEAEDLSARSDPEGLIQFYTVFRFGAAAAAAGATEKVAKGLYGLQSFPATGFGSGLWVPRTPPWLAIWLVLISHVGCRQGTYFKAEAIIWQRRKFTASQMSSLALINLFINSTIIY